MDSHKFNYKNVINDLAKFDFVEQIDKDSAGHKLKTMQGAKKTFFSKPNDFNFVNLQ